MDEQPELFAGEIALVEPLGVETLLHIKIGEQLVVSTVPGISSLRLGEQARFDIAHDHLHFFRAVDGAWL